MKDPRRPWALIKHGTKVFLCLCWGIPLVAAGILCAASIVFIWLTPFLFAAAGWPLAKVAGNRAVEVMQWDRRDQALSAEGNGATTPPPWETNTNEDDGWQPV